MIPSQINVRVLAQGERKFLQLTWTDPETGQLRKRSAKTSSRREAERLAAKLEKELRAGCAPDAITWAKFRDRHENEARNGLSDSTCQKYDAALDHLERILKPKFLRDVTTSRLSEFVRVMATEPLAKDRDGNTTRVRTAPTIGIYCRHIKAALRWAKRIGLISYLPTVTPPKATADSKGRPITTEEFERMIDAVLSVRRDDPNEFKRFLYGLWWSGLRIGEALQLSWDATANVQAIVGDDGRATLRFKSEGQKARRGELWPCAPEFALFLAETPEAERTGRVFKLGTKSLDQAKHIVGRIGKKAGVVVDEHTRKTATAHDPRRSFGTRWSHRVMPAVLQRLMRHKSIQTTLTYYVWSNVNEIADALWNAYDAGRSTEISTTSDIEVKPNRRNSIAEAGIEPARGLPPTGF